MFCLPAFFLIFITVQRKLLTFISCYFCILFYRCRNLHSVPTKTVIVFALSKQSLCYFAIFFSYGKRYLTIFKRYDTFRISDLIFYIFASSQGGLTKLPQPNGATIRDYWLPLCHCPRIGKITRFFHNAG